MLPGLEATLAVGILTGALFSASSFSSPARPPPALPELPLEKLENFQPAIRAQIRKAYERVQKTPENGEASGRLGMVLHAHELYEEATASYRRAELLEPESFAWAYYLAVAQSELGNQAEAVVTLRRALRLNPDYFPAQLKLAQSLLAAGKLKESGEIYEALVKRHSDSALAHYGLGQVQSARGEPGAAIERYQRACRLSPDFGAAYYALAMSYRDLGQRLKSKEQFSLFERNREGKPVVKDPFSDAIRALQSKENFHFHEGVRLEEEGKVEQAVAEYERALEVGESDVSQAAHRNLAFAYGLLGRLDKAKKHYRAAVEANPSRWEIHSNFGILLRRQGRYKDAAVAFGKALQINPFAAQAHSGLAELLAVEGRLEEATRHCHLALENDPHSRLARFTLVRILQRQGRNGEAIEHILKTLKIEDEMTPLLLFTLSDAYARVGKLKKAVYYAQQAKSRALSLGQVPLATDIERFLQELKK